MKILLNIIAVLVFVVAFTFCKKKADPTPAPVAATPTPVTLQNTKEYVKYTVGTKTYSYTAPDNGFWSGNSGGLSSFSPTPNYYSSFTTLQIPGSFFLCISDSTNESSPVSDNFFKSFLKVKDFNYDVKNFKSPKPVGIFIELQDSTGYLSTTKPMDATPFQQSSNFKIIECVYFTPMGSSRLDCKFKATFNCKLYRPNGDSVNLTNGEIITALTKF